MTPPNRPTTEEIATEILRSSEYAPTAAEGIYDPRQGIWWNLKITKIKEALDKIVEEKDTEIALNAFNARQIIETWQLACNAQKEKIHSLEAELKEAKESRQRVMTADMEIINELQAQVKRLKEDWKIESDHTIQLMASLSLAVGALKEAKETLIISERDTPLFIGQVVIRNSLQHIDEALSSPAIQKEVQRIEAMERIVETAQNCFSDKVRGGLEELREAIKAYEEAL